MPSRSQQTGQVVDIRNVCSMPMLLNSFDKLYLVKDSYVLPKLDNHGQWLDCPIALEPITNPVLTGDGSVFEEEEIMRWLSQEARSPCTNLPLPHRRVLRLEPLRLLVEGFLGAAGVTATAREGLSSAVQEVQGSATDPHDTLAANVSRAERLGAAISRARADLKEYEEEISEASELCDKIRGQVWATRLEPSRLRRLFDAWRRADERHGHVVSQRIETSRLQCLFGAWRAHVRRVGRVRRHMFDVWVEFAKESLAQTDEWESAASQDSCSEDRTFAPLTVEAEEESEVRDHPRLGPGVTVRVAGLESKSSMEGMEGTLKCYHVSKKRWQVNFREVYGRDAPDDKLLRPTNLHPLESCPSLPYTVRLAKSNWVDTRIWTTVRVPRRSGDIKDAVLKELRIFQDNEHGARDKCIVFCNTVSEGNELCGWLMLRNIPNVFYHSQEVQRHVMLDSFLTRDTVNVLISTSILDLWNNDFSVVKHVIRYGLPELPETFIYECGLASRNPDGKALVLVNRRRSADRRLARHLLASLEATNQQPVPPTLDHLVVEVDADSSEELLTSQTQVNTPSLACQSLPCLA